MSASSARRAPCSGSPGSPARARAPWRARVEQPAAQPRHRLVYVLDGDNVRHGAVLRTWASPRRPHREHPPHRTRRGPDPRRRRRDRADRVHLAVPRGPGRRCARSSGRTSSSRCSSTRRSSVMRIARSQGSLQESPCRRHPGVHRHLLSLRGRPSQPALQLPTGQLSLDECAVIRPRHARTTGLPRFERPRFQGPVEASTTFR